MSKLNLTRPQHEEFWDDCIKLSPKKNVKFKDDLYYNSRSILINLQKNKRNKIIFRQKNSSIKDQNHKLIKKVLTTEESMSRSIEKRKLKQINILTSLYNNHILKKRQIQNVTDKLKEDLILKEKKMCTFKPKYFTKHRAISERNFKNENITSNTNNTKKIYERSKEFKDKLYTKLKYIKRKTQKDNSEEYPFQPDIRPKNIGRVLYGNNFWEDKANNLSNEIFLRRYKKAREEDNYKKSKKIFYYYSVCENGNNEGNNKSKKKIVKSISQKNSLIFRQTLHNYLLEFETNDEDHPQDNKNNNLDNNKNIKIIKNY
jgi:hypothetical protein